MLIKEVAMSNSQIVNVLFVNVGLDSVIGYFRPMSDYNKGKKSEFKERKWFTEEKIGGKK